MVRHSPGPFPGAPLLCPLLAVLAISAATGHAQSDTTRHGWPVTPFASTHIITGTFCEFRNTLTADHFHNGIDIPMPDGSPVYPVYDGVITSIGTTASSGDNAFVRVRYTVSGFNKSDAYVHIDPNPRLQTGDSVFAFTTVIGYILPGLGHVHFTHGLSGSEMNAIRPNGGMTPYIDSYPPVIASVGFFVDGTETQFPSGRVSGAVDIRAHIKETNAADPSGLFGSTTNNGTYVAGYRVLSGDGSTVVFEPPSGGVRFRFDRKPVDADVHNVFASGSDLSTHIYTITNGSGADQVNSTRRVGNGFWDTGALPPGPYRVVVWAEDTRGLRDSAVVDLTVQASDAVPPAPPVLLAVTNVGDDSVAIRWKGGTEPDLAGYRLSFTLNGTTWVVKADESALGPSTTSVTYPIGQNQAVYFRVVAVDGASPPNLSTPSDIYGIRLAPGRRTLIVDGFDRTDGSYQFPDHPFAMTHARSIRGWFASCANDALLDGSVSLADHDRAVWVLGDESAADETFSAEEQRIVKDFIGLTPARSLIISGSEIAYDLDRPSGPTQEDRDFLHAYLKGAYAADDAGIMSVAGTPSTIFSPLSFRYGVVPEGSPYEEDWPDVLSPVDGGEVLLRYGQTGLTPAAIGYRGLTTGDGAYAVATLGFPFETITTQAARDSLMDLLFAYTDLPAGADDPDRGTMPGAYALYQNYPNPFNPVTNIRFTLTDPQFTTLKVHDILGREVATLVEEVRPAGTHTVAFDGTRVGSGTYYAVLTAGGQRFVRSMLLLK